MAIVGPAAASARGSTEGRHLSTSWGTTWAGVPSYAHTIVKSTAMTPKAFHDAIERRLTECSADELRDILRALAANVPPEERANFVASLHPRKKPAGSVARDAALLDDIREFSEELEEHGEHVDEWEGDDEDTLGPYERYIAPAVELAARCRSAFEGGRFEVAARAYEALSAALSREDDYGRGLRWQHLKGVDLREERARYLRAVYESNTPDVRPGAVLDALRKADAWESWGAAATLQDVAESSSKELPEREAFLRAFIALLGKESPGRRTDARLREAVAMLEGVAGLERLAREEGDRRPRVYVDLVRELAQAGQHGRALEAAREAFARVPKGLVLRAEIADVMRPSAQALGDRGAAREAAWEAFRADGSTRRLLDLRDTFDEAQARAAAMREAAIVVDAQLGRERHTPTEWDSDAEQYVLPHGEVKVQAHLLAGDLEGPRALAAKEKQPLGWSYGDNPQALVVPFVLRMLWPSSGKLPKNLEEVWETAVHDAVSFEDRYSDDEAGDDGEAEVSDDEEPTAVPSRAGSEDAAVAARLEAALIDAMNAREPAEDAAPGWLRWAVDVARARAHAIAGGARRRSYGKAAVLLGACGEVLHALQRTPEVAAIYEEFRKEHGRKWAFVAELDAAFTGLAAPPPPKKKR